MKHRLDALDDELEAMETAIRALGGPAPDPKSPFGEGRSRRTTVFSSDVHPRFHSSVAQDPDQTYDLERAAPLILRSRPSWEFSRGASRRSGFLSQGEVLTEMVTFRNPCSTLKSSGAAVARGPRWGSQHPARRLRIKVRLGPNRSLGLVFSASDRREVSLCVASVLPGSSVAAWNASCQAEGLHDLQVRPGDSILEVDGKQVCGKKDLEGAVHSKEALQEVVLSLHRFDASPGPDFPCSVDAGRGGTCSSANRSRPYNGGALKQTPSTSIVSPALRECRPELAADNDHQESERFFPGRYCRAVPCPPVPQRLPIPSKSLGAAQRGRCETNAPGTFGGEARFEPAKKRMVEVEDPSDVLLNPSDRFCSNKPTTCGGLIQPLPCAKPAELRSAKRLLKKIAGETRSETAAVMAQAPGLRGLNSAWLALLREELLQQHKDGSDGDTSTDVGSDRGDEVSSFWSSNASELLGEAPEPPGPGAYSPQFDAVEPRLSRGVPSFSRYLGREPQRKDDSAVEDLASTSSSAGPAGQLLEAEDFFQGIPPIRAKGGKIMPLPSHHARALTARAVDTLAAAERPFYDLHYEVVEPAVPSCRFGTEPGTLNMPETGRLQRLEALEDAYPGPGSYEISSLRPGGPAALIMPEPVPVSRARAVSEPPGPGEYDGSAADSLVYTRAATANFHGKQGHRMEFQQAPEYVSRYQALHPNWELVERRSLAAVIVPEHPHRNQSLSPGRADLVIKDGSTTAAIGPGTYDPDDRQTQRLRPDVLVGRWPSPRQHKDALDRRPLPGSEDDVALRRHHPSAIIRPLSEPAPLRRSWAAGDTWRLYDPVPPPEPTGVTSFSRRITFEDFRSHEARWEALESLGLRRRRPSLNLAYSLPSLDVTGRRAPEIDFSKAIGRLSSDGGDSIVEGDVLLLASEAERNLFHPRAPSLVNMKRQTGREDPQKEVDDFEELVLSPRPVTRRTPVFVDMARSTGRAEPDFSANVWEEVNGAVYTYRLTSGLAARDADADELILEAPQVRISGGDFARPLGRPGHDPRIAGEPDFRSKPEDIDLMDEVVLTHWQPPQRSAKPVIPRAPPLPTTD